MAEMIAGALVRDDSEGAPPPVSLLALASFVGSTEGHHDRQLDSVNLLRQVFAPYHIQLPVSLRELGAISQGIMDGEASSRGRIMLEDSRRRARVCLDALRKRPEVTTSANGTMGRLDAWRLLLPLAGSESRRLSEEHYAGDVQRLLRFQCLVDHYYLMTASSPDARSRRYLLIDDNLAPIIPQLATISQATGATFWATRDGDACRCLQDVLSRRATPEFGDLLVPLFVDGAPPSCPQTFADFDAALVDLLIRTSDGGTLSGEHIVASLADTCPELPTFVVSRSEEPDVLARCLRFRGADRVVPKRRILRLPHANEQYLREGVSPLLPVLAEARSARGQLDKQLLRLFRTWNHEPDILWLGEKTFQGPEHSVEHHRGLWRLVSDVLGGGVWECVRQRWQAAHPACGFAAEEVLFCFLLAIWLHDVGCRGDAGYQHGPEVRPVHAFISGRLIDDLQDAQALGIGELHADLRGLVADLCRYHQSTCPLTADDLERLNAEASTAATRGLFECALEPTRPYLLPWLALLRLLDAVEHGWKRAGGLWLRATRLRALDHERRYYEGELKRSRGRHREMARDYLAWLGGQAELIEKHRQIAAVGIKMERTADGWNLLPGYRFAKDADHGMAVRLTRYVGKEWLATGRYLEQLGITWPYCACSSDRAEQDDVTYITRPR